MQQSWGYAPQYVGLWGVGGQYWIPDGLIYEIEVDRDFSAPGEVSLNTLDGDTPLYEFARVYSAIELISLGMPTGELVDFTIWISNENSPTPLATITFDGATQFPANEESIPVTLVNPEVGGENEHYVVWGDVLNALGTNLISRWRLDESSGNAIDSRGANDLTENGGPIGSVAGKVGTARDFESASSHLFDVADNEALSTGDTDFTIAAWVKLESVGVNRTIVSKWDAADNALKEFGLIYLHSVGRFRFEIHNGTTQGQVNGSNSGALALDTWYLVIAWHDAANDLLGIRVNDAVANTASFSGGPQNSAAAWRIGARKNGLADVDFWDGAIDDVMFWKRVLTEGEMDALYNGGDGLEEPTIPPFTLRFTYQHVD